MGGGDQICPICNEKVSSMEIEAHVNACLDKPAATPERANSTSAQAPLPLTLPLYPTLAPVPVLPPSSPEGDVLLKKRTNTEKKPYSQPSRQPINTQSLIRFDSSADEDNLEKKEEEGLSLISSLMSVKGASATTSTTLPSSSAPTTRLLTNEEEERAYLQRLELKRKQEAEDLLVAKRIQDELSRTESTPVASESRPTRTVRFASAPLTTPSPPPPAGFGISEREALDYASNIELAWRLSNEERAQVSEQARQKEDYDKMIALVLQAEEQEARDAKARERKEREDKDHQLARELAEKVRLDEERARTEAEQARKFDSVVRTFQDEVAKVEEEKKRLEKELERMKRENSAKKELEVEYPDYWHPRQHAEYQVYEIASWTAEWKNVNQAFVEAGGTRMGLYLEKVQRIQNKTLYNLYYLRREQIHQTNHRSPERLLYHGSRANAYSTIQKDGFDVRVSNLNGALGAGVYFSDQLSTATSYATGNKLLFCRVAVGQSGTGVPGIRRPPQKPGSNKLFDSVARDNMYVVFDNYQAYPEYLITYGRW